MHGDAWMGGALKELHERGLWRSLDQHVVTARDARTVTVGGHPLVCFASNDYLGLSRDPVTTRAATEAVGAWGSGSGGSRHINGNLHVHRDLEHALADFLRADAAVLFGSGFLANMGAIRALVGPGDHVFSDELNHASLVDGCRQSRAQVHVYRHADLEHLGHLLAAHPGARRLVVTDSVFSMEGDLAPLAGICSLAESHDAMLLVDEAHAIGTVGGGAGLAVELGLHARITVRVVTLGKALGSYGAAAVGRREVVEYLLNAARSLIFSTALPPSASGAALAALAVVKEGARTRRLAEVRRACMVQLRENGLDRLLPPALRGVDCFPTPIAPLLIGDNGRCLEVAAHLAHAGFLCVGVRPPTVPAGAARLRVALKSVHTDDDVKGLCAALASAHLAV